MSLRAFVLSVRQRIRFCIGTLVLGRNLVVRLSPCGLQIGQTGPELLNTIFCASEIHGSPLGGLPCRPFLMTPVYLSMWSLCRLTTFSLMALAIPGRSAPSIFVHGV